MTHIFGKGANHVLQSKKKNTKIMQYYAILNENKVCDVCGLTGELAEIKADSKQVFRAGKKQQLQMKSNN